MQKARGGELPESSVSTRAAVVVGGITVVVVVVVVVVVGVVPVRTTINQSIKQSIVVFIRG